MRSLSTPNPVLSSILAILIILSILGYWVFSAQTPAVPADGSALEASAQTEGTGACGSADAPYADCNLDLQSDTVPAQEASAPVQVDAGEVTEAGAPQVPVEASTTPVVLDAVDETLLSTPQEGTSN